MFSNTDRALVLRERPALKPRSVPLRMLLVTGIVTASLAAAMPAMAALDAFPGAQGHGSPTQGGRGGRIIYVDNLKDSGPGSLRACVEATMPRNCVFRVSGTIVLAQSLLVGGTMRGNLSILGQTAPGGGITITVSPKSTSYLKSPLIIKNSQNVIVRHVRLRPQFPNTVANADALTVEGSNKVYVDHVSGSWATDENFNSHGQVTNMTVAYSIFGEGLRSHSKCALIGSDPTGPQNISFWRNLCVSNVDRNPDNNHYGKSCIEVVDNLFYNARSEWSEIFSQEAGGTPISYVGNYYKAGPSTLKSTYAIRWNNAAAVATPKVFEKANATWAPTGKSVTLVAPNTTGFLVSQPPCGLSAASFNSASRTYAEVAAKSGAFPRDAIDRRLVREVGAIGSAGGGSVVLSPGQIPAAAGGTAYVDADRDGMSDADEPRFGAKPGVSDAWADGDRDGWPNFDAYMEWLSKQRLAGAYPR